MTHLQGETSTLPIMHSAGTSFIERKSKSKLQSPEARFYQNLIHVSVLSVLSTGRTASDITASHCNRHNELLARSSSLIVEHVAFEAAL